MRIAISIVVTVLNEFESISDLLFALQRQTLPPVEVIIVDAGSSDGTIELIKKWQKEFKKFPLVLKVLKGSTRSRGRNWAIQHAKNELIAITDAGCVPEPQWLEELVKMASEWQKFEGKKNEWPVVAGYYRGLPQNNFEEAVVPYALVPPHRVDPENFLPASRSMLLPKKIWQRVGKFPEELIVSEDFVLARKIQAMGIPIVFAGKAIVGWRPRQTVSEFVKMLWSFAVSDAEYGAWRKQILMLFGRYLILFIILWLSLVVISPILLFLNLFIFLLTYSLAAIRKNAAAVSGGWYWLPLLQFVADGVVMTGTLWGLFKRITR
jgi:glycosyltransferase involved in cell wall biosynthesis